MQFSNMPYQRSFQKNLMSYFAYLALCLLVSNLKFYVTNSKKEKKSIYSSYESGRPNFVSLFLSLSLSINQALLMLLLFCAVLCLCAWLSLSICFRTVTTALCVRMGVRAHERWLSFMLHTYIQPVAGRVFSSALSNLFLARQCPLSLVLTLAAGALS